MKARYTLILYLAAIAGAIDSPQLRAEVSEAAMRVATNTIEVSKIPATKKLPVKCIALGDGGGMSSMSEAASIGQAAKLYAYTKKVFQLSSSKAGDMCLQEIITHISRHNPTDYLMEAACDTAADMGLAATECKDAVIWGKR